ncbi:TonB-dependent receptor [Sphingomonas sp.]|jgi:iron complex outermembrane receptor protein|uniref:TonB-dependent receptor n=1 Tax=Sphingomonas sp. TaxID=28214 RepID=UPI002DEC094C|nr:TonB-dependent receptor [Sphingomonas sp.]
MRRTTWFAAVSLPALLASGVSAQTPSTVGATAAAEDSGEIVVTARKREETLADVPIAATALTGEILTARGINSVREAAALTPGLNINSDGTGRAFVSIRGVGVTLVATVQPGVGLFIDGIYQPNTSYLNNPLVDVERIEVLRGPQGTLYGKNTMGGAINVITRVPGNDFHVRGSASYAGPDNAWTVSAAAEGAIVPDKIQVRVAAAHREQDGFIRNVIVGGDANPLNTDSINGTIRFLPSEDVTFTLKGYYDWVDGANTPYARVTGPTDYSRNNQFNVVPRVSFRYRGLNGRLDFPAGEATTVSLIGSYDMRDGRTRQADVDFGPADLARATGRDKLRTTTLEARFDSEWNDQFSSLFGLFYSRETLRGLDVTTLTLPVLPAPLVRTTNDRRRGDTYAAFGTIFWKPTTDWEVSLGLRYDHESRRQSGQIAQALGGTALPTTVIQPAKIKTDQLQPKLSVTRHFDEGLMAYASVARGYRGGGFNAPTAPFRTYMGDNVWTYEVGGKYVSDDRRFSLSGAVFYNDYKDYIGLNSIAMATGGGLVTVDLNAGDVESYGLELETRIKPTEQWTISGGLTLMHARLQNFDAYTDVTGRILASNRLTFQPDVTGNLYSDYEIPLGNDSLTLTGGVTYKGKRLAATLNETTPTFLKGYALVNAAATYRHGPFELGVFANNLFNKDYFESYIEKTTLQLAGLPASDLGIIGDRRRYGVRASFRF